MFSSLVYSCILFAINHVVAVPLVSGVNAISPGGGEDATPDITVGTSPDSILNTGKPGWHIKKRDYVVSFRELEAFAAPTPNEGIPPYINILQSFFLTIIYDRH
jgi:hypothetical protein